MNLVKPNKAVKYLTDGKRIWILYSPHTGWEQTIMAEVNATTNKVSFIVDGCDMKDREKIINVEIRTRPREIDINGMELGLVMNAYWALEGVDENSPYYNLAQSLKMHCDSENILVNTTSLDSDFANPPKGPEIADLLDVFRRTNLEGAKPEDCICGVCCDLDNQCKLLEDEGLIVVDSHSNAIGIVCESIGHAIKATENLKNRGFEVAPIGPYPDTKRNFITYILKKTSVS